MLSSFLKRAGTIVLTALTLIQSMPLEAKTRCLGGCKAPPPCVEERCCFETPICPPKPKKYCCASPIAYVLAGGALGAGTGALTGYLTRNNNSDCTLSVDRERCLVFEFDFQNLMSQGSDPQLTFFVTQPDQTTLEAQRSNVNPPFVEKIYLNDPLFGVYSAGVRLGLAAGDNMEMGTITMKINVSASRDKSVTEILSLMDAPYALMSTSPTQMQFSADFTYNNKTIP